MRAIRTSTHKLIVNFEVGLAFDVPGDVMQSPIYPALVAELNRPRDQIELYDLIDDPLEQNNRAGRPELASFESDLRRRLSRWMRDTNDPLLDGPIASNFRNSAMNRLLAN
jgi:hypothetical protein